jgi:adenylate kinase family enzyme
MAALPGVDEIGTRISVVGNAGSGKSTFAAALADRLGLRHIELDSIYHQPGWQPLSQGAFCHRVRQALGPGDWVVDGNYRSLLGSVVWDRAETVVCLDYPLPVVARRIIARTARRARTGEPICNGNVETWSNLWARTGIVRWALSRNGIYRARYQAAAADPRWQHLRFVFLTSPAQAQAWLTTTTAASPAR